MKDRFGLHIIDWYIIRKFLGTFFFTIVLIIMIAIVFDISEKLDDFIDGKAPLQSVIFDYYLNFIPFFAVLFSPLFAFISVIYFTSRMAYNTEIAAILSSGISFNRLLVPYFLSALILAIMTFSLSDWVIPHQNARRLQFEELYYHSTPREVRGRIHQQIEPGVFIYLENFNTLTNSGRRFSMEKFVDGKLVSKLMSDEIIWDSTLNKWNITNYYIKNYIGTREQVTTGFSIDTTLNITPEEFRRRENAVEAMNLGELNKFIKDQKLMGTEDIDYYLIEKHNRFASPFSTFILTLIGVSVSSKKVKGGIGMQLGIGLLISFSYIVFMQFSSQFAISGSLSPFIAAWIPNILFAVISLFVFLKMAPK
jgi:lipopolysaccharide export system permease protein